MFKFLEATKKLKELESKTENIVSELKNIDFIFKEACREQKDDCWVKRTWCENNCTLCFFNKKNIYDAVFSGLKNIDNLKNHLENEENNFISLRDGFGKERKDYETQIKTLKDEINILYDRITNLNKALALWEATKIKNV